MWYLLPRSLNCIVPFHHHFAFMKHTEGAQHREHPPQMIVMSDSLIGTHLHWLPHHHMWFSSYYFVLYFLSFMFPLDYYHFFLFSFWPHCAACGILVPQSVTEPAFFVLAAQRLNHWTTREAPRLWSFLLFWRFLFVILFCSDLENRHIAFNSMSGYSTFFSQTSASLFLSL